MNKVILMGRLTRDPEVRYSQGENATAIARYTLAVDRRMSRNNQNGDQTADFIQCVAFGRSGEISAQGNKGCCDRQNPDRIIYEQGRTACIYDRRCRRGSGVC